jgi:hypothetical protein
MRSAAPVPHINSSARREQEEVPAEMPRRSANSARRHEEHCCVVGNAEPRCVCMRWLPHWGTPALAAEWSFVLAVKTAAGHGGEGGQGEPSPGLGGFQGDRYSDRGQPGVFRADIPHLDPDHHRAPGRPGQAEHVTVEPQAAIQVAGAQRDPAIPNARGVIPPSSRRGKTRGIGLPGACRDGRVHEAAMRCRLTEPGSDVGSPLGVMLPRPSGTARRRWPGRGRGP